MIKDKIKIEAPVLKTNLVIRPNKLELPGEGEDADAKSDEKPKAKKEQKGTKRPVIASMCGCDCDAFDLNVFVVCAVDLSEDAMMTDPSLPELFTFEEVVKSSPTADDPNGTIVNMCRPFAPTGSHGFCRDSYPSLARDQR